MGISRTAIAAAAIVIGPTYLLFAQPAADPKPIGILLAAGDVTWCTEETSAKTAKVIQTEIDAAKAAVPPVPVRVLALGDLAYPTGEEKSLDCFKAKWGGFYDVLLPVPGNHEYEETNLDGAPYFTHFKDHALVNQQGAMKGYYAVTFPGETGPWKIVALNPYVGGRGEAFAKQHKAELKTQLQWLEANVDPTKAGNDQNCVLAFLHPPLLSSGHHGHGESKKKNAPTKLGPMQDEFGVLYRHHASVVVAGHDHNYEQFAPHDEKGKAAKDGIRSFVVGTGGAGLYRDVKFKKKAPNSETYNQDTHGVLKISLFENSYAWDFLPIEGKQKFALASTKADCNKRKP